MDNKQSKQLGIVFLTIFKSVADLLLKAVFKVGEGANSLSKKLNTPSDKEKR